MSQGHKLSFLVHSRAVISLVKSEILLSTAEFEPTDRVRVKSVEGSVLEIHGSLETQVREGDMNIPYRLKLVSKQVDLKGDGILGCDILAAMRVRICYRERVLIFRYKGVLVSRKLMSLPGAEQRTPGDRRVNKLTLPARTEIIVQVPVDAGPGVQEGIVERAELMQGVYMAESLFTVAKGCVIATIINTTEEDVELFDPVIKLEELGDSDISEAAIMGGTEQGEDRNDQNLSRGERE